MKFKSIILENFFLFFNLSYNSVIKVLFTILSVTESKTILLKAIYGNWNYIKN